MLSHVAVRARNSGVLMAACLQKTVFNQLKAIKGKTIRLEASEVRHLRQLKDPFKSMHSSKIGFAMLGFRILMLQGCSTSTLLSDFEVQRSGSSP